MAELHISKVAVGCSSLDALRTRQQARRVEDEIPVRTRYRPRQADRLVGGSIYWIIKHRLVARQSILGFAASEVDGKTIIRLDPELIALRPVPKRAHQGWRYLEEEDCPPDLNGDEEDGECLPPSLAGRLSALALI